MHKALALSLGLVLAGCVSAPKPARAPVVTRPVPPQRATPTAPAVAPSAPGFIAPTIMRVPGLEAVIGADARRLAQLFGTPALTVREGDALKLQYAGRACVLEIFLYPLRPGGEPSATHVEARRASDGQDVDRAACVAALRK